VFLLFCPYARPSRIRASEWNLVKQLDTRE
jgi:hypothetical protein